RSDGRVHGGARSTARPRAPQGLRRHGPRTRRAGRTGRTQHHREAPEVLMKMPRGFLLSGVRAGIRRKRPDLALLVAEDGANAAAVFTKNRFQAAPVGLSKRALARSHARA